MNERDLQAAEYALGLLDGEGLLAARSLAASDPAFARAVDDWHERVAPLFEEVGEEAPPATLWDKVRSAIAGETTGLGRVVELKRKVGVWKAVSAAASAVAASLALVVVYDQSRQPPLSVEEAGAEIMVASLMSPAGEIMLSATCQPDAGSLMLMPAAMDPGPGRSYQLWIIPAGGKPHPVGLVEGLQPKRMVLDPPMASMFGKDAMLALTMEPAGGAPGDAPTGPYVASGPLRSV